MANRVYRLIVDGSMLRQASQTLRFESGDRVMLESVANALHCLQNNQMFVLGGLALYMVHEDGLDEIIPLPSTAPMLTTDDVEAHGMLERTRSYYRDTSAASMVAASIDYGVRRASEVTEEEGGKRLYIHGYFVAWHTKSTLFHFVPTHWIRQVHRQVPGSLMEHRAHIQATSVDELKDRIAHKYPDAKILFIQEWT